MDVKSRSISDLCTDTSDCHVAIVEVSNKWYSCGDPESFVRGGPTLTFFGVFFS